MKQFFKIVFASMFGAMLSFFVLIFIFFVVVAGIVASAGNEEELVVKSNSVLHIKLNQAINERSADNPFKDFDFMNLEGSNEMGLDRIVGALKAAKDDANIQGILLDINDVPTGLASTEVIRNALLDFKKSGKYIYAYSEMYSQKAYYLASTADSIFLNPAGLMELRGFNAQYMFFKGSLEKLEIEPQIIRVGSFKSAVEPFMLEKMSDSNRLQTEGYLNALFNHMIQGLADARKKPYDSVLYMAQELSIRSAEDAVKQGMVDRLLYKDELLSMLQKKTEASDIQEINFVEFSRYTRNYKSKISTERNKIAIIYCNGDIISGEGNEDLIGSEGTSKAIRKARLDDNVKAVVLRINSPGGSALASDVIWREVILTKMKKPVIVSMGDVAASGGYYIACAADSIIAEPSTITGSIGVFGVLFNAEKFFRNKMGITFDQVKTGKYADLGDFTHAMTDAERAIIQNEVNRIYEDFTTKVAAGRKMPIEKVKRIAEGRVWSGIDAKRIGLVDRLGNLEDAIAIAAKMAKLDAYKTISLPEIEDPFAKFMRNLNAEASMLFMPAAYKQLLPYQESIEQMKNNKGIQMRMTMLPTIN